MMGDVCHMVGHMMSDVGHMVGHMMSDVGHMMSGVGHMVGHMMGGVSHMVGHMMGGVSHMVGHMMGHMMGHTMGYMMGYMNDVSHMIVDEWCKNDGSYKCFLLIVLTDSDFSWSPDIPVRHCTKTMACLLPESIWNLIQ